MSDLAVFRDLIGEPGRPATAISIEAINAFFDRMAVPPQDVPLTYVIDATIEAATGLPRGSVQPAHLTQRRLALRMMKDWPPAK